MILIFKLLKSKNRNYFSNYYEAEKIWQSLTNIFDVILTSTVILYFTQNELS